MSGNILVLSGPSGSGKSTLLARLMSEFSDIYFSISSTTRAKRDGEIDGVNYHFISQDEFKSGIENSKFLEWAYVHKNYYGTSLEPVTKALQDKKTVVFDIDVQGYNLALQKFKQIITSVFITTKDSLELKKRLESRNLDSEKSIKHRLLNAKAEMKCIDQYDYLIINTDLQSSYDALRSIFSSMRSRIKNLDIDAIVSGWDVC